MRGPLSAGDETITLKKGERDALAEGRTKGVVYVAGPLFNAAERAAAEGVEAICRRAGFRTFLPHRDAGLLGSRERHQPRSSGRMWRGWRGPTWWWPS